MKHVLVVGASRGIGFEFVRQYRADAVQVTGTARDDAGLAALTALGAQALRLDVTDEASCKGLTRPVQGADGANGTYGADGAGGTDGADGTAYDLVVLNAGVYGPKSQGLQSPTEAEFDHVMHTNVLGPMRLLSLLEGALAPGGKLAVISSRMGSIGSRSASGGWLYRASKAALNSVLKDASLALAGRAICVAFHPGWVRTDMGGEGADLDVATAVADMRRTLAGLGTEDNGSFRNHDGSPIPW